MGKQGIIAVIPKDYARAFPTQETSLRQHGYSRFPGTMQLIQPYKEFNSTYRTGLDPNASYITSILDPTAREAEKERVTRLKKQLEEKLRVDLSSDSSFWKKVDFYALKDGDNIFNLDNPYEALTFAWLRVHPLISPSLQAYERGEVPPSTTFYVKDKEIEEEILYKKTKKLNDCIIKFNSFSPEKRKKILRVMGLPVSENESETFVYNHFNKEIQSPEMVTGPYKGRSPVDLFTQFSDLDDHIIEIKDLVEQLISHQIYRIGKGGKIFEGEMVVYDSKEELTKHLLDEDNQFDLLEAQKKLNLKQLARI